MSVRQKGFFTSMFVRAVEINTPSVARSQIVLDGRHCQLHRNACAAPYSAPNMFHLRYKNAGFVDKPVKSQYASRSGAEMKVTCRCPQFSERDVMLFLKSTSVSKAPGIYEVDVAAKPPGKTFAVFLATDPDNPPVAVLSGLAALGFHIAYQQAYTHRDKGKVLDLHFEKHGTDLFNGWKADEGVANMAALEALFSEAGLTIVPRVMSLAEAYA